MKNPPTAQSRKPIPKYIAAGVLSVVVFGLVMLTRIPGRPGQLMAAGNDLFYDFYYKLRPIEDRTNGPVVILAIDDASIDAVDRIVHRDWPWPRDLWGLVTTYLSNAGAKAIVFDITFTKTSPFESILADDDAFASAINSSKSPVFFSSIVNRDGSFNSFGPPVNDPKLVAVNLGEGKMYRTYSTVVHGRDSLATAVVKATNPEVVVTDKQFLLHFYGPTQIAEGKHTYRYIPVANVINAQIHGDEAEKVHGVSHDFFKGKTVLIGAVTMGTYDLKACPLSDPYPGVEVHATGIDNMLNHQEVLPVSPTFMVLMLLSCTLAPAFGVIYPRTAWLKLLFPVASLLPVGLGIFLFRGQQIYWLAPAECLVSLLLTTPIAFAYTYFVEDRQSRFMLEALSKVVSPTVAATLSKDPVKLARDTDRRVLTVLFSDLANFTSLSEHMSDDNRKLVDLLDDYLDAMSDEVIKQNGTLDKYIGDSVMCFWNAPVEQADHAERACRAALNMQGLGKEYAITVKNKEIKIYTRIGINTTLAGFGFVGSSHLMNYTVLGDGVNLASRLEGANKLYGTRILIARDTADLVRSKFHLRRIDSLVVKGKTKPVDVFEVLAECGKAKPVLLAKAALYESALRRYQRRRWDAAEQKFLALCEKFGDDPASRTFLKRITAYRIKPPPDDWDGAYGAEDK